jgi:hypothetical protein
VADGWRFAEETAMSEQEKMPWGIALAWTQEHTQEYLKANPLPVDFEWQHRDGGEKPVVPSHSYLKGGYGKWLRETPYFPGLFELVHDVLVRAELLGDAEWLAGELTAIKAMRGRQESLF